MSCLFPSNSHLLPCRLSTGPFEQTKYPSIHSIVVIFPNHTSTTIQSRPVFASGYVSLVKQACDGELVVVANGDADTPLRLGQGVPLVSLDLWEHAYLLDVGINRDKHILDAFNIIHWDQAETLYEGDLKILLS